MAVNDLAGGNPNLGSFTPEQLFAGEAPIITDNAVATTTISKYEVVKLAITGNVKQCGRVANVGSDSGKDYAIAAQPSATGKATPLFTGGFFNHALLVWPADLDNEAKRAAFFRGTEIHIGHIRQS